MACNLSFLLTLMLHLQCAGAAFVPVTWNICGLLLENGESVTGSFVFDADIPAPNPPYRDINIKAGLDYKHALPISVGNSVGLYVLADPEPQDGEDYINRSIITFTFTQPLTNQGTTVLIATSDEILFAGIGQCAASSCLSIKTLSRYTQNNPFVSVNPCPSSPTDGEDDDDSSCNGPTDFFSIFSWIFCFLFKFLGSLF